MGVTRVSGQSGPHCLRAGSSSHADTAMSHSPLRSPTYMLLVSGYGTYAKAAPR